MRTSRVSRDTARILSATRAGSLRRTRATAAIRDFPPNADEAGNVTTVVQRESVGAKESSDSELSSVPDDVEAEGPAKVVGTRKRKRGQNGFPSTTIKVEKSKEVVVKEEALSSAKTAKPKKARRIPAKKSVGADGSIKVEPPPNWEEVYALTRQMREAMIAPVDTMGCDTLADRNDTPRNQRFQTLVALMLSSQTKDTVTSVAIKNMQKNMPGVRINAMRCSDCTIADI
jgi:endonuclease III